MVLVKSVNMLKQDKNVNFSIGKPRSCGNLYN